MAWRKLILLGVLVLLMFFHFVMLTFYCSEFSKKRSIKFYSQAYITPFFHQNWRLFTPPPDTNYSLVVETEKNGKKIRRDIFAELILRHQSNRLLGLEPVSIALVNSIFYFEKNTLFQNKLNGPIKNDLYFTILEKAALGWYQYLYGTPGPHAKVILFIKATQPANSRVYFN